MIILIGVAGFVAGALAFLGARRRGKQLPPTSLDQGSALYEKAPPVQAFDDLLRAQARRLSRRLEAAGGAGLAATQISSLRRMFAFRFAPEH